MAADVLEHDERAGKGAVPPLGERVRAEPELCTDDIEDASASGMNRPALDLAHRQPVCNEHPCDDRLHLSPRSEGTLRASRMRKIRGP